MFGITDFWIATVYILCILSSMACVIYGIINWNKGVETEQNEIAEEKVPENAK